MKTLVCVIGIVMGVVAVSMNASAVTLRWNPGPSATQWDAESKNWLDGSTPTVWVSGATAQFDGTPEVVEVAGDLEVGVIVFVTNGYTLGGEGRLRIAGGVSVAAGTTSSIAAELYTSTASTGLTKLGYGTLALGKCVGRVTVAEGTLLVGASEMTDAQISVASGAVLETFGGPGDSANLIVNGGFEDNPQPNGNWRYVTSGANIEPWFVPVYSQFVGRVNSVGATEWVSTGSAPEGDHVLILQYNASVQQDFTVSETGWYTVAFSYFLRRNYHETLLTVLMDNKVVSAIINDAPMFSHKRHVSVPIWLTAGTHTLSFRGEGEWGDRTSLIDDVCVAKPSALMPCLALGGDSEIVLASGATATLNHAGNIPLANLNVAGGANVSGPGAWGADPAKLWYAYTGAWSATPANGQDAILRVKDNLNALPTDLARRVWFSDNATLASSLVLTNSATHLFPRLSVTDGASLTLSSPLAMVGTNFVFDAYGAITLQDDFAWTQTSKMYKSGFGPLSFAEPLNMQGTHLIFEGDFITPGLTNNGTFLLSSLPGRPVGLTLTQPITVNSPINFSGRGNPKLTMATTGIITNTANAWLLAPETEIDITADATFSQLRFLGNATSRGISPTGFIKSGPGTLEIRSGGTDTGNSRSYQGRTTLRNGTLRITADATANIVGLIPYNNTTPNGSGGTLGCGPASNAVIVGDSGTQPGDTLTFIADGNNRFVAHDFEVFDKGASVTFATTNTLSTMFAGAFKLHRDVRFVGPEDAFLAVGPITHEPGFNGTGVFDLDGFATLQLGGALPSALHLDIGTRTLILAPNAIIDYTIASFAAGSSAEPALLEIECGAGKNDSIQADTLTLGKIAFRLFYGGTSLPFSEPGTYTLFRYTTFNGNVSDLSIENPDPAADYTFADTGTSIELSIAPASGMTSALWVNPGSGDWGTAANWYGSTVPNGAGISTLLGSAISSNSTVTLNNAFTVGSLSFNHGLYQYTLDGAALTVPTVSVLGGSHVIKNTLASGTVALSTAPAAKLTFDDNATIQGDATLNSGTIVMAGEASVQGELTLAAKTTANLTGSNITLNALSGQGTLSLNNATLTFQQQQASRFEGAIRGQGGSLTKDNSGTLALAGSDTPFTGGMNVQAGNLTLEGASAIGGAAVSAGATLEAQRAATNGLMGYYYIGNPQANSNSFLSISALEAYLAPRKPDLIWPSGLDGGTFNYANVSTFPYPFGQGGPTPENFAAVWRGTITLPESGLYSFRSWADDFHLFAIDGTVLTSARQYVNVNYNSTLLIDAGRYDILAAVGQMGGGAGIRLEVRRPSSAAYEQIPSSWLTPAATVTTLAGNGTFDLTGPEAIVQIGDTTTNTFNGTLAGVPGARLLKNGTGALVLTGGASAFGGDLRILSGSLALNAPGLFSDTTTLHLATATTALLNKSQTVGALTGSGLINDQHSIYTGTITGDADSGFSTDKTYTHLVNLPVGNSLPVTINDVEFDNRGNWRFIDTTFAGAWGDAPNNTVNSGISRLTWFFNHGTQHIKLEVSGLTPNTIYEYRQYFRNFNNNPRNLTLTFFTGDNTTIGSIAHNPDTATTKDFYSFVACVYRTDASGKLTIHISSANTSDTCHFYGFSNEEVTTGDERLTTSTATLTVAPALGERALYAGNSTGAGRIVKDGDGTQVFSGVNTMIHGLEVSGGNAVLLPGATVSGPATIGAGATLSVPFGDATVGGLAGDGTLSLAGPGDTANGFFGFAFFTNDVQTGISPEKCYTHTVAFGDAPTVPEINGVTFTRTNAVNWAYPNGYGWTGAPPTRHEGGNFPGDFPIANTNGVYDLLTSMNYGNTSMTLTGLKPGTYYELRIYNRRWQSSNLDRTQTFDFICDLANVVTNTIVYNPDALDPNALIYRYVPEGTELRIIIAAKGGTQMFHCYGFTNEELATPSEAPTVFDLPYDSTFGGTVTGLRGWEKRGDSTLLLTGHSTVTGPLTVTQGAFGVANGGVASCGPVLATDGTLLFGHGTIGADVTLASGAGLQAGAGNVCGTLATSGDLLLAPGANVKFRYASTSAADTFLIGGTLTLPETGVISAHALTASKSPASWPLFIAANPINGPETLHGWTVDGLPHSKLSYSHNRTRIYIRDPRGTVMLIR